MSVDWRPRRRNQHSGRALSAARFGNVPAGGLCTAALARPGPAVIGSGAEYCPRPHRPPQANGADGNGERKDRDRLRAH